MAKKEYYTADMEGRSYGELVSVLGRFFSIKPAFFSKLDKQTRIALFGTVDDVHIMPSLDIRRPWEPLTAIPADAAGEIPDPSLMKLDDLLHRFLRDQGARGFGAVLRVSGNKDLKEKNDAFVQAEEALDMISFILNEKAGGPALKSYSRYDVKSILKEAERLLKTDSERGAHSEIANVTVRKALETVRDAMMEIVARPEPRQSDKISDAYAALLKEYQKDLKRIFREALREIHHAVKDPKRTHFTLQVSNNPDEAITIENTCVENSFVGRPRLLEGLWGMYEATLRGLTNDRSANDSSMGNILFNIVGAGSITGQQQVAVATGWTHQIKDRAMGSRLLEALYAAPLREAIAKFTIPYIKQLSMLAEVGNTHREVIDTNPKAETVITAAKELLEFIGYYRDKNTGGWRPTNARQQFDRSQDLQKAQRQ